MSKMPGSLIQSLFICVIISLDGGSCIFNVIVNNVYF